MLHEIYWLNLLPRVRGPVISVVICTLYLDPSDKLLFKAGTLYFKDHNVLIKRTIVYIGDE